MAWHPCECNSHGDSVSTRFNLPRLAGRAILTFELLLHWIFILLGVYVLLLLIASARHKSSIMVVSGMSGLLIGLFALTWLSILILIIRLLFALFGWIVNIAQLIITAIFSFLLWSPILYTILGIVGIVIVAGLINLAKGFSIHELWVNLKEWLRNMSAKPVVFLLAILAVAALIWFVGIPLWEHSIHPVLMFIRNWVTQYIVPIVSWVISVLFTLVLAAIVVLLALTALGILGWQFADQFLAARSCGLNTHTAFEAGFATGAVLGLVLLVCAANPTFRSLLNVSWSDTSPILSSIDLSTTVYYLMPAQAERILHKAFEKASLPVFDLVCLIAALLMINSSLITGLFSRVTVAPIRGLVRREGLPPLGKALFGFVIAGVAMLAESFGNGDT